MDDLIDKLNTLTTLEFKDKIVSGNTDYLLSLKDECDRRYYITGEDTIDDTKFDILVDELKNRGVKLKIGCTLKEGDNKVELPVYLPGMDKIKSGEDSLLNTWYEDVSYVISDKLNGVSCLVGMIGGEYKLFTRGDKNYGSDISYFKNCIAGIKNKLKEGEFARGEIMIRTSDYNSSEDKKKNILSTIVGAINAKTLRPITKLFRFIAYEFISDRKITPEKGLDILKKKGFEVVNYSIEKDKLFSKDLCPLLNKRREESPYDIDGLIIQKNIPYDREDISPSGNPKYAIAFKDNIEVAQGIVQDVIWNVSRYGKMVPIVKIKPQDIHGITVKKLTGFNAQFIQKYKINKGSEIIFTRSGDIIPYIISVTKSSSVGKLPDCDYVWKGVDIFTMEDEDKDIGCITFFFQTLGCKHVSTGTITKLYKGGYTSILSIIESDEENLLKIKGIGMSAIENILSIVDLLQNTTLLQIAYGSCKFEGFGMKRLENIFHKIDIFGKVTLEDLVSIEGISHVMGERFIESLPQFLKFYKSIKKYIKIKEVEEKGDDKYNNLSFVLSGFRDKNLEDFIKQNGGNVSSTVTKKTSYLIVKDLSSSSTKVDKAKSLSVKIITKEEFNLL